MYARQAPIDHFQDYRNEGAAPTTIQFAAASRSYLLFYV